MIKNKASIINNGLTVKQRQLRKDLCTVLESVLFDIDPYRLVKQNLALSKGQLTIGSVLNLDLSKYQNIYVVGAGKAVYKMALAVEDLLGRRIASGFINVPVLPQDNKLKLIKIHKARHPIPDSQGVYGTKQIKKLLLWANKQDLIIAVMSGGGSALMPLPAAGISLRDKIKVTSLLLRTSATIHEINVVRKHLSQIKGGQFASLAYPATVVALYISDIVDDPFDIQASGPTAPDPSTFEDAVKILKRHGVWKLIPRSVSNRLVRGQKGLISETPGPDHEVFSKGRVYNFTIGNHNTALVAAARSARKLGYNCLELTSSIQGEAREISKVIVAIGKHIQRYGKPLTKPALVIAGGETTVQVRGKGLGGRNQELVLSAIPQIGDGMAILSFGTDGIDGITPKPVAGAIADLATKARATARKLNWDDYLDNNNSYNFFKKAGGHLYTGPTGTNVGDLILLGVV